MPRRRYDTGALVGDMKRERRNAVLLSLVGVTILVFLVVYFTRLRGTAVPEVPYGAMPTAPSASPNAVKPAPAASPAIAAAPASTSSGAAAPAVPATSPKAAVEEDAMVQISLPRPGPVLIDGEIVAKKAKTYDAKLTAGKHKIATKIGHKTMQLPLEVMGGRHYRVDLDPKKKRGAIAEVTP